MKVLLTGSTGQLGRALIKNKPDFIELISPKSKVLNLSNKDDCYNSIKTIRPDWVINCGAYTNVEDAEKNKELAFAINSEGPNWLAKGIRDFGGHLMQLSTDFVFDGNQNNPYTTYCQRNPINIYGESKYKGEIFVESTLLNPNKYIILRTSWLMGPVGNNFALTVLRFLRDRDSISIVNDQFGAPTSTSTLSKVIWIIIEKFYRNKYTQLPKILHWCDSGIASWYDIAEHVKEIALELNLIRGNKKILPIPTTSYPTIAKRPNFSLLDTSLTNDLLDIPYKHWRSTMIDFMKFI